MYDPSLSLIRVDNALGMDYYLNSIVWEAKQPVGFHYFQPFIH